MSQENHTFLRFSLEESVWFKKGQEVAELLSISLDPKITILENDQFITINGSLELSGEYMRNEYEAEIESADFEEGLNAPKFISSILERAEGGCEFSHNFPVDISIPLSRIQGIDDLNIEVESFDYVFPEASCMNVSAEIIVSGLVESVQAEVDTTERDDGAEQEDYEEQEVLLEIEPTLRSTDEVIIEDAPLLMPLDEATFIEKDESAQFEDEDDLYAPFEAVARKEPSPAPEVEMDAPLGLNTHKEEIKGESYIPPYLIPDFSFLTNRYEKSEPSVQEAAEPEQVEMKDEPVEVEMKDEPVEVESPQLEEQPEEKQKKASKKKKSLSISEFLARKEGEEHAKLKVCIVQQGDTIDYLAERYEVSVPQLLKVNHLEISQDIYEGQVLYIPVEVAHN
ncbi:stage VI sporulation protein D [Bacillus sp. 03113]|uniref:stage VI sporulation protein D n=1 Tax=Bacillus sp. 03113 TaxID=2578211 RepID=UPI00114347D7|nr:stage VI sporulation protein D [Bacillus sp. 03113]